MGDGEKFGPAKSGREPQGWFGRWAQRRRRQRCLEMAIRLFETSQEEDDSERLGYVMTAARAFDAYLRDERPRDAKAELLQFPGARDRP